MSVENEDIEIQNKNQEQPNDSENKPDLLIQALSKRDNTRQEAINKNKLDKKPIPSEPGKVQEEVKTNAEGADGKKEKIPEKQKEEVKESNKPIEPKDNDDDEDDQPEHVVALEKTKKSLSDTKKWGNSINMKLKGGLRELQNAFAEGDIDESVFNRLSEALHSDHEEPKEEPSNRDLNPLSSLIQTAKSRMEYLKEALVDDESFDDKLDAFDFLMHISSGEDKNKLIKELSVLKDNPIKLAKKIYLIGQENIKMYQEIQEAGGFKPLLEEKDAIIKKKQNRIDKLEKRVSEYEGNDKGTNRIDELGLNVSAPVQQKGDLLTMALSKRDAAVRARSMRR